jgi:hypothetical protein
MPSISRRFPKTLLSAWLALNTPLLWIRKFRIQDSGSDLTKRFRIFSFIKAGQVDLPVNHYPLLKYIKKYDPK